MARLLEKLLASRARVLEAAPQAAARSFNTNAMREVDDDERGVDVGRRSDDRVARPRGRDDLDAPFFAGSRLFSP